ncbi:lytic transglycosylase domain-containing protein [Aquabacterium sp. A08]|uniref:lytic transglycosylase domain-containing protein n=1 Tax=Aquabacterium sp. A08 TaxID=2718532 RepID=UPI0035304952
MPAPQMPRLSGALQVTQTAFKDVAQGFVSVTHNSLALLGLLLAACLVLFVSQPDLRSSAERQLFGWLEERQSQNGEIPADPSAVDRVTATNPKALPREQAQVADWLSRKYRVAPEPIGALVAEAFEIGDRARLDPTLILAVMAIESRFNPFAASPVGAQGLMQVMTRVHADKYEDFGGRLAAFDPVSNLRVGAQVLQETIRRAGSVEGGLRLYVGAVSSSGQDYIDKVLSEHERLQRVAQGQRVAFNAHQRRTVVPTGPQAPQSVDAELEAEASPTQTGALPQAS